MKKKFDIQQIQEFIKGGRYKRLRVLLRKAHYADLGEILSELDTKDAVIVLRQLGWEARADVFGYCERSTQVRLSEAISPFEMSILMNRMPPDDRADILNELNEELKNKILHSMERSEREDAQRLTSYPEDSAGSVMTTDFASLPAGLSVLEAIEQLRREAHDKETISIAYVVDSDHKFLGAIRLEKLVLAQAPSDPVEGIMEAQSLVAHEEDSREEVARKIAKYDLIAMPIVDSTDRLVGIVSGDDAIDVLEDEATEDFHKAGGMGTLIPNVRDAGFRSLYRLRAGWLLVLVFANIFSGAGIAYFEDTIAAYVSLVFFLPILIGGGGNAGSQSATLMVRALATGDLRLKDWGSMLGREIFVATALGVTMALAISLIGIFRSGPEVAIVVGLTMVAVVIVGSVIGMSLPFVLHRFNTDPAAASAPLITSIADAAGVVIYFSIATHLLPRLLS